MPAPPPPGLAPWLKSTDRAPDCQSPPPVCALPPDSRVPYLIVRSSAAASALVPRSLSEGGRRVRICTSVTLEPVRTHQGDSPGEAPVDQLVTTCRGTVPLVTARRAAACRTTNGMDWSPGLHPHATPPRVGGRLTLSAEKTLVIISRAVAFLRRGVGSNLHNNSPLRFAKTRQIFEGTPHRNRARTHTRTRIPQAVLPHSCRHANVVVYWQLYP